MAIFGGFVATSLAFAPTAFGAGVDAGGGHGAFGELFLLIALLLLFAKIGGVIEKLGQPSVLGELLAGIALSFAAYFGIGIFDEMRHNETLAFLAEIGAVILLFQIGLESNLKSLATVGASAFKVAIIGVIAPLILGTYVIGPLFFADAPFISHLFIGAAMVATSVGVTASVFKALGTLKSRSSQTVLGAAVIDDVLGLLVLAIVSAMASGQELTAMSISVMALKAGGFLVLAIVLGRLFAPHISKLLSKIHTGTGMKLSLAFIFALLYAYAATLVGLAPIIGAFAAGLILDDVHFNFFDSPLIVKKLEALASKNNGLESIISHHRHTHVEDMVSSLALIFVPLFFAYTGLQIQVESLLNPQVYLIGIIASVIAIGSKMVSGFGASGNTSEKLLIGMSMVPRGEVGLIFAATGKALGAISDDIFSVIIVVVILTTVVAPAGIAHLTKKI